MVFPVFTGLSTPTCLSVWTLCFVLFSSGCYNKSRWLISTRNPFLSVLDTGTSKVRESADLVSGKSPLLVYRHADWWPSCRWSLFYSSYAWISFMKALIPLVSLLFSFLRALPLGVLRTTFSIYRWQKTCTPQLSFRSIPDSSSKWFQCPSLELPRTPELPWMSQHLTHCASIIASSPLLPCQLPGDRDVSWPPLYNEIPSCAQ